MGKTKTKRARKQPTGGEGRVILFAEDEELLRGAFARNYVARGYEVLAAGNGREALDLYRKHRPPVVVTDLNMPVMGGYELAKRLSKFRHPPYVIVFAAPRTNPITLQPDKLPKNVPGADEVISKNAGPGALRKAVERAFANRKRQRN